MFGFFKKQVHEPIELQREDVIDSPLAQKILSGEYCDEISTGYGTFGSLTNPIPVNGAIGELKYLGKLRGLTGRALFFHRVGSVKSPASVNSVDLYEVVCMDGTQWNKLYFDIYHPRRSEKTPPNYTLKPFDKNIGMDIPYAYGVNHLLDNFPYSLPDALIKLYGSSPGETFARRTKEILKEHNFARQNPNQEFHVSQLKKEFGLTLDKIPESHIIIDIFKKLTTNKNYSKEAKTSLFFRLIALQYTHMTKILIEKTGEELTEDRVGLILNILDRSVDWSEAAEDHYELELATSHINMNIEGALEDIGIYNGSK